MARPKGQEKVEDVKVEEVKPVEVAPVEVKVEEAKPVVVEEVKIDVAKPNTIKVKVVEKFTTYEGSKSIKAEKGDELVLDKYNASRLVSLGVVIAI